MDGNLATVLRKTRVKRKRISFQPPTQSFFVNFLYVEELVLHRYFINFIWIEVQLYIFLTPEFKKSIYAQNGYSTRSRRTPCRRLWCFCPRIFGRRHLPSKRAWKVFYVIQKMLISFLRRKTVRGTWTMNQNALWQLKCPQTKTRKTNSDFWLSI